MLEIIIPSGEMFDEEKDEFINFKSVTLQLEHSLISLSKWESKWHKPFLSNNDKSREEIIDYIRCMTINTNVDPKVYIMLSGDIIKQVSNYIEDSMTATTFSKDQNHKINRDVITAEIIYYWMVALTIPFQCEKWHLNRLLTLINVCNIKNQPKKKMPRREVYARNRSLNAARRASLNTTG